MKKIYAILVIVLLVSAGLIPVVSASMKPMILNKTVNNDSFEEEDHPAYYNVTRYHFKGFTCTEETIQVSYEDAMMIKKEFEKFDTLTISSSEKNDQKKSVLKQYDLLLEAHLDQLPFMRTPGKEVIRKNSETDNTYNELLFVIKGVDGTIGPCYINVIPAIMFSPAFFSFAKGADLTLLNLIGREAHLQTDDWVIIFMGCFNGIILVIPFISPGGYMYGITMVGSIVGPKDMCHPFC